MACHLSGGLLATAGADRKVLVWDVDGGFCTHFFKGHAGVVSCIMFHPDPNKSLVSSNLKCNYTLILRGNNILEVIFVDYLCHLCFATLHLNIILLASYFFFLISKVYSKGAKGRNP
jgi:WD40 repeat protein